jgi:glycosyltransferase involved in cell wall biosynthesis
VDAAGVERLGAPAFEASLRLHPVQTAVGLARLGAANVALRRLTRRFGPDVLHANTPRAGLMCAAAARPSGPPLVVHLRDDLPLNRVGRAVRFALVKSSSEVVAVSGYTAGRFNEGLERPAASTVYNSIDLERFDSEHISAAPLRAELGLGPDAILIAQVAQITPWKRQDTAIRALAALRRSGLDAHLLIVGEVTFGEPTVRYDNHAFERSLHALVDQLDVRQAVHFLGRRDDVPGILEAVDLSLLPSVNEPFGRAIVESMAVGTPPLVSDQGSGPELVDDRATGRVVAADQPERWATAARELLLDRAALAEMGARARERARDFGDEAQVRGVLAVYERLVKRPAAGVSSGATEVASWHS